LRTSQKYGISHARLQNFAEEEFLGSVSQLSRNCFNELENFTKSAIAHALCRISQKKNFWAPFLNFQEFFLMNLRTAQNQLLRTHFAELRRRRIWGIFLNFQQSFNEFSQRIRDINLPP
jgi:hypothetical protein